jgi:DUF4097 and DUF4098 domain-containing protein YvlB
MKSTNRSPIDILGITLGVIVALVVVGSIVMIVQGRMVGFQWSGPEWRGAWNGEGFSFNGTQQEEKDEQVQGSFTELQVRSVAGSIEIVEDAAATAVNVHSVKKAWSEAAMQNLRVDIQKQGSRLVVEEKYEGGPVARMGTISFVITVPKGMKVMEAHTVSGSITVRDVGPGIDQTLATVSGSISTSRAGNLEASTTSGGIRFAAGGSRVAARSVSGSIEGDLTALDKGGSVSMSTVSGSIGLAAFAGLDASLSLHTVSGRVSCDFPVTISEQRNNRLDGKIGSGSARIEAGSTSGSITISKM